MKGIGEFEYSNSYETKPGVEWKEKEYQFVHPMAGSLCTTRGRFCPHGNLHPQDVPFCSQVDFPSCDCIVSITRVKKIHRLRKDAGKVVETVKRTKH
jgi:hypothetical protein